MHSHSFLLQVIRGFSSIVFCLAITPGHLTEYQKKSDTVVTTSYRDCRREVRRSWKVTAATAVAADC